MEWENTKKRPQCSDRLKKLRNEVKCFGLDVYGADENRRWVW